MMVYDNNDISYVTSLHATSWQLINIIYNIKNLMVYLWFLLYLLLPSHYTKNNDIMMEFINTKYIYCYKFATYCYIFVTCSIAYPCMQVFVAVLAGSIYGIGGTNWVMCLLDTMKVFGQTFVICLETNWLKNIFIAI